MNALLIKIRGSVQWVQRADSSEVQGESFSVVSGSWRRATTGLSRAPRVVISEKEPKKTHELLHRQKWNGEAWARIFFEKIGTFA